MTTHPLEERFLQRAALAGIAVPDALRASLLAYYDLLFRWNSTINLTSLLDPDQAIDRLLLEPVAAARHLPVKSTLIDLGSGGGSPAIPLALTLQSSLLVMVESKVRKAVFLREAVSAVDLEAIVEAERFEALTADARYRGRFAIVSMRAVRMDEEALVVAASFVVPTGIIALFVSAGATPSIPKGLRIESREFLMPGTELLLVHRDVPRETPVV